MFSLPLSPNAFRSTHSIIDETIEQGTERHVLGGSYHYLNYLHCFMFSVANQALQMGHICCKQAEFIMDDSHSGKSMEGRGLALFIHNSDIGAHSST
jgi:hypothetical protein